ncbi:phage tail protein [Pantoea sp. YU22]|uniref:phage tail sheath subtilisin-like domain-containing protein n=1 Tax=Pantoea sp. YU22 TaxID=2497684 RepID=UPI000F86AA91|nr:phage tail sheath subtilisin-like domain-containing protein [Pantoea sp. YU22]RTY53639.1 phage tail protein [Pantoea sp. YU22]
MSVSFNNIPGNIRVPLFYAEMDNSAANTAQASGASLMIAQALPDSVIERDKVLIISSADQVKKLAGRGSPLARMVARYRKIDPYGELYIIAPKDDATLKKAEGSIALAGKATEAGAIYLYVGSDRVQVVVSVNDTPVEVGQAMADKINANADLPVTAVYAAATESQPAQVIVTAKWGGVTGNNIPLSLNYYGATSGEETPEGINVTITAMKGGVGDVVIDGAVAAMGDNEFDYIGLPFSDASALSIISAEMNDDTGRWSWSRQLYGHVYTVRYGSLSDLVAFGDSKNEQHITVCGYEQATQSPLDEVVAARLARQAVYLRIDPARPTQTGEITGILPAPVGSRFSLTEFQSLLTHGIATASVTNGVLQIQRDITTYKKNKFGVEDNSYLDSETLHTSAYVLRRLKSVITSKYPRHKLASDGTRFGAGQAIVTPAVLKGEICSEYRQLELAGIVENFALFKQHLIVERNANDPTRVDVLFPPDYVNQLRVFALLNQFRLQYNEETA